jgi:YHS domain-containing protein
MLIRDPVCGALIERDIDESFPDFTVDWAGESYSFCSENCQERFIDNPGNWVHGKRSPVRRIDILDESDSVVET